MTGREIMDRLAETDKDSVITLSPGPLELNVDKLDAVAIRLIDYAVEQLGGQDNVRTGDILKTFQSAIWWVTFLASIPMEK